MCLPAFIVALRASYQIGAFGLGECADDSGGHAERQHAGRNVFAFRHKRGGSDDGFVTDDGVIEDDGVNTDQDAITQRCSVNNDVVTDGAVVADGQGRVFVQVQGAVILNVGAFADDDGAGIAANDSVIPDARALVNRHIADDDRARGNKYILSNRGPDTVEG